MHSYLSLNGQLPIEYVFIGNLSSEKFSEVKDRSAQSRLDCKILSSSLMYRVLLYHTDELKLRRAKQLSVVPFLMIWMTGR